MRTVLFLFLLVLLLPLTQAQPELNKRVRITDAGELYSTFDLGDSEASSALRRMFGASYNKMLKRSTESGWPSGLATLSSRQDNRDAIESFVAYEVYRFGQYVVLVIPASENTGQPADLRSSEDFYMIFNEPGIEDFVAEEAGTNTASGYGTAVKLLATGGLRSTYNLSSDEHIGSIRRQLGDLYAEVVQYSQEDNWPKGIATLTARDDVRDQMLKYKAWKIAEFGTICILRLPAAENKHMPPNMRPDHDIYFVIDTKDIREKD